MSNIETKSQLQELISQHAALERQIAQMRQGERTEALSKIRELMSEFGLSANDLGNAPTARQPRAASAARNPVAAKYRDQNGNSWSGRGLKPKWLTAAINDGHSIEEFAV